MISIKKRLEKADLLRGKARYREALKLLKGALKSSLDTEEEFQANLLAGHVYRMLGDFDKAITHYETAIKKAIGLKDRTKEADASVSLALSERARGNWRDALKLLEKAEKIYSKNDDAEAIAFLNWSKAGTYRIKGDIDKAIETFRAAYAQFKKLKDGHAAGYCLNGLGGATRVKGLFRGSMKYYSRANKLFTRLKEPFGLAYSYCGVGNALRMEGDWKGALQNFKKALVIYNKIGDIVSSSYTLWSVSKTYELMGKLPGSEKALKEAVKLFNKTKDPRGRIYCLLTEAELAAVKGKKIPALRQARIAFESAKEHSFGVEACHASLLIGILSGTPKNDCYKKLGLKLKYGTLPLNIP